MPVSSRSERVAPGGVPGLIGSLRVVLGLSRLLVLSTATERSQKIRTTIPKHKRNPPTPGLRRSRAVARSRAQTHKPSRGRRIPTGSIPHTRNPNNSGIPASADPTSPQVRTKNPCGIEDRTQTPVGSRGAWSSILKRPTVAECCLRRMGLRIEPNPAGIPGYFEFDPQAFAQLGSQRVRFPTLRVVFAPSPIMQARLPKA